MIWLALLFALAAPAPAAAEPPLLASELLLHRATPALDYRWSLPPEVADAPAFARALRAEALADEAKSEHDAAADMASMRGSGFPGRPYQTIEKWTVTADTPRLLALLDESYAYTGGAHGNTGYAVAIWDRRAMRRVKLADMFTDWPAALRALTPDYCAALEAERKAKRAGNPVQGFDDCPALKDAAVSPLIYPAGPGAAMLRVTLGPYAAGPYSEGAYTVEIGLNAAALRLVRPAWRDVFAAN